MNLAPNEQQHKNNMKVELKPCWSLFKYIYKSPPGSANDVYKSGLTYFTIPLGSSTESGVYHYLAFPAMSTADDIVEFYYYYPTNSIVLVDDENGSEADEDSK